MNTKQNNDTQQLTPRIRLEHTERGWAVTVDDRAPEPFTNRNDAITFARGVDIGHACHEREASALLEFVREHVEAKANCIPLHALFGNDDQTFHQAVTAYFSRTNGGGIKATELVTGGAK